MKKRFLGIICLLYSGIIGYVWLSDKLKNFLAPQMQIYIKCSLFIILIIGLILCFSKKIEYKFKISDLILLLPVFMLILAGDGRLTASLVNNRMTNLNSNAKRTVKKQEIRQFQGPPPPVDENVTQPVVEEPTVVEEPPVQIEYDTSKIDYEVIDENYYDLANYIVYTENTSKFTGKTIRVSGFIVRYASFIPFGHFAIGKYGVGCCTADANFVGYIVKLDENIKETLKNNDWYEIEGVLEPGEDDNGYSIMAIHVINIKKIDSKKQDQYVYPCTSYGDGSCKAFKKYQKD